MEKKDDKGKYLEDGELTDKEIQDVLYELKEGKKTLATQKKVDSSDDENDNGGNNQPKNQDTKGAIA